MNHAPLLAELPEVPVYLPFERGPYRMAMGLVAREPDDMIAIDRLYPDEMAQRRDLLATRHGEVFGATEGTEDARAEVLEVLADMLPRRFPRWFARDGHWLDNRLTGERWNLSDPGRDTLELAALLVQEDLCLLRPEPDGPVLTAAALCFPSRWRLHEKLGHRLAVVHQHVPFYGERLARPVDRLMSQLKAGKLVERLNWSMNDDPALFQPTGKWRRAHDDAITPQNAGETLFLRVERQTLRSLPRSGAVLFTIRVYVYPLALIASAAEPAGRLAEAIRALPDEMQHYKSLIPFRTAVLDYLDQRT
jgi:dimethylamine monooxygenase subunit A